MLFNDKLVFVRWCIASLIVGFIALIIWAIRDARRESEEDAEKQAEQAREDKDKGDEMEVRNKYARRAKVLVAGFPRSKVEKDPNSHDSSSSWTESSDTPCGDGDPKSCGKEDCVRGHQGELGDAGREHFEDLLWRKVVESWDQVCDFGDCSEEGGGGAWGDDGEERTLGGDDCGDLGGKLGDRSDGGDLGGDEEGHGGDVICGCCGEHLGGRYEGGQDDRGDCKDDDAGDEGHHGGHHDGEDCGRDDDEGSCDC